MSMDLLNLDVEEYKQTLIIFLNFDIMYNLLHLQIIAIIKVRGVTTKFKNIFFHHANFQRTKDSY